MNQKTVLLLFGGESSEHEVSINSARNVYAAIDNEKFNVVLGFIDKSGKWWLMLSFDDEINTDNLSQILPNLGEASFISSLDGKIIKPDVILPILHGKNGEDGAIQALAVLLHIPIVGCDMTSSAICMDKVASKQIAAANDIPVVEYVIHRSYDLLPDFTKLQKKLSKSLFVKPSRAGSSLGASKVNNVQELDRALKLAHQHDDVVLIERCIVPRELEVAILGNVPHHIASGIGEIKSEGNFYSYETKYSKDASFGSTTSADIDKKTAKKIRDYALKIFTVLGCRGLSRVDFFLTKENELYFNEINTLPGFTNISMYPKLWQASGMAYPELIEKMIILALEPVDNNQ